METARMKVAVLDDYQCVARQYADWASLEHRTKITFYHDHVDEPTDLLRRLEPYQVICLMRERTKLDATALSQLPNLRLIVTSAMRNAAVDIVQARKMGIMVCGTGAVQTGTPELVWLHILAFARNFEQERAGLRQGRWQVGVGRDLHGATLGILGLGRIGQRVATVGCAFGMKVLAWSPNLTADRAAESGAEFASRHSLFENADFLVLAMQLRPGTRGLVTRQDLLRMKSSAYLINTARAGLIDEQALLDALRAGRIAGAGLDVFDTEPLPPAHPYRTLPNITLTPHLGYVTANTYQQFYTEMVQDIQAWLDQTPIRVLDGTE
ncbi:2-hydroxyacid dehydrogenase [Bordetella ansorpii]|uniref:2-hydroxyacid dehydrogenase n=1 Tax=Bordetella ansorpii TaxID=288768 RepID=A0A157P447_9BORD|nr:D-2-hydroxyacid dehydrogenase family protein [Bordetella ansorpii]SAI27994.1 2-hydroxyacid dehydrogenase [Bordetella ansorpii]